jgi:molybdopterin/thiamine biosynthesis adenylyltransferase
LVAASFKPVDLPDRRVWQGPIAPALVGLTDATTMRIAFVDGWPYRQPRLLVEGLTSDHANNEGEVCLWETGARSRAWLTLQGFYDRIGEWVDALGAGFPDDGVLDAHLYFASRFHPGIATIELGSVGPRRRHEMGRISGRWLNKRLLLELRTGRHDGQLTGSWYFADHVPSPPRNIDDIRKLLTSSQVESLNAGLTAVEAGKGERLALVVWETPGGTNALTFTLQLVRDRVEARAIETAPTDQEYLAARAGPDFEALQTKRAVLFGAGAVGSHLALRLAECGIGHLVLHDSDLVRPGNVVRHVADRSEISLGKPLAVEMTITKRLPWTQVEASPQTWNPDELADAIDAADITLDATGNPGFTDQLSEICRRQNKPLISAALYRGGAVGRICRQATPDDTPICERDVGNDPRHPLIPPGDEAASLEPGCSAPVNNAPPSTVAAVAAYAAEVAIDTLIGKFNHGDELIEVYRPLETAPFDTIGTVRVEP